MGRAIDSRGREAAVRVRDSGRAGRRRRGRATRGRAARRARGGRSGEARSRRAVRRTALARTSCEWTSRIARTRRTCSRCSGFRGWSSIPGGPPERPYDVAGWTLPLQMGVKIVQIDQPLSVETTLVTDAAPRVRCTPRTARRCRRGGRARHAAVRVPNAACRASGCTSRGRRAWTRGGRAGSWTTSSSRTRRSATRSLRAGGLATALRRHRHSRHVAARDSRRDVGAQVPPQYAGGVGADGIAALKQFVEDGGHLVLVDGATELAPAALGIDVKLVTRGRRRRAIATRPPTQSRSMRRGRFSVWSWTRRIRSGAA